MISHKYPFSSLLPLDTRFWFLKIQKVAKICQEGVTGTKIKKDLNLKLRNTRVGLTWTQNEYFGLLDKSDYKNVTTTGN